MQLTRLLGATVYVLGILLLVLVIVFVPLLMLLGLAAGDVSSLYAAPAGLWLRSNLSPSTAYLFAPASPIDDKYQRLAETIQMANGNLVKAVIAAVVAAADYVSVRRSIQPRLPA